jgi:hypothetical protein
VQSPAVVLGLFLAVACGTTLRTQESASPTEAASASPNATPLARLGACSAREIPPEDVVSRFFSIQKDSGIVADLADCWSPEARTRRDFWSAMEAWSHTGGADRVETLVGTRQERVVTFQVAAWLKNWSELTWGPGQTRWLVVTLQADNRWQINELRASPP